MKKINIYVYIILRIFEFVIFVILLASNFNIIEPIGKTISFFCFAIIATLETYFFSLEQTKYRRQNLVLYLYLFILFVVSLYVIPILFKINDERVLQLMQAISITLIGPYWIILLCSNLLRLNSRLVKKKKAGSLHN